MAVTIYQNGEQIQSGMEIEGAIIAVVGSKF